MYAPSNSHSPTNQYPPSHDSKFLRWHASLNSESDPKTNAGTQKKWKNRQRSSLTQLGVWPLQGVCHAPHSHTSSNEGASDDVSLLSNGRLCAGACDKIPRTFAHSVGLFNLITSHVCLSVCLSVCALRFVPRTPPKRHRFRPWRRGGPLFAPPTTSARVQSRFEFVEIGGGMRSNYHRRHWDYRLAPVGTTHIVAMS